jgi:rhamnosyltransferase
MDFSVIIPTLDGGETFQLLCQSIIRQTYQPDQVLVIDSGSTDSTREYAERIGFAIKSIHKNEFNHGKTRQMGIEILCDSDIIIFLTQDAILSSDESFFNLLKCFDDSKVGAAYGRQLPHQNAKLIESHARLFNYPSDSNVKSLSDIPKLGIKTVFISNSFAAYKRKVLMDIGGFPSNLLFGEDAYVAAKMLLDGWEIAYCADAKAYHSHNYSYVEEFRRYFDIGVFHSRENWIKANFGKAEGEGKRFIQSEFKYLLKYNCFLIPSAIIRNLFKFVAYKVGSMERFFPLWLKIKFSMNKNYWKTN